MQRRPFGGWGHGFQSLPTNPLPAQKQEVPQVQRFSCLLQLLHLLIFTAGEGLQDVGAPPRPRQTTQPNLHLPPTFPGTLSETTVLGPRPV